MELFVEEIASRRLNLLLIDNHHDDDLILILSILRGVFVFNESGHDSTIMIMNRLKTFLLRCQSIISERLEIP